jgi:hypothetical protein
VDDCKTEFVDPLETLRQRARATPHLIQDEDWRVEMTAAIAAARACGVSSDTLADFEALLRG